VAVDPDSEIITVTVVPPGTSTAAQPRVASGLAAHEPPAGMRRTGCDDSHIINNNPSIHTRHLVHAYLRVSSPNASEPKLRAGNRSTC
jgi:hypothetical protein